MTLDDAQCFVRSIRGEQRPVVFSGDLDDLHCDGVADTDGLRKVVWVQWTDGQVRRRAVLAKFRTWEEAESLVATLVASTGVRERWSEYVDS